MGLRALIADAIVGAIRTVAWGIDAVAQTYSQVPQGNIAPDSLLMDTEVEVWPEAIPANPTAELIATQQWGLQLPSGEVVWNLWQGTNLNDPLGRVKAIALLQQAAMSCGYSSDQYEDFLSPYDWVTRNQLATVVYEETGAYSLTDPQAIALGAPSGEEPQHVSADDRREAHTPNGGNNHRPHLREGLMGGDAGGSA
jgi:hypothetical protein